MSTDTTTTKTRTITLTDRRPVTIIEADWPIIASAAEDSWRGDPSRYQQALQQGDVEEYSLRVRQHTDGRVIVYAVQSASYRDGVLLEATSTAEQDRRGHSHGRHDHRDAWRLRGRGIECVAQPGGDLHRGSAGGGHLMATSKDTYLRRAVEDFEAARQLLIAKGYGEPVIDHVTAVVVLAARLEAVEDAIANGLPTAGEGI